MSTVANSPHLVAHNWYNTWFKIKQQDIKDRLSDTGAERECGVIWDSSTESIHYHT